MISGAECAVFSAGGGEGSERHEAGFAGSMAKLGGTSRGGNPFFERRCARERALLSASVEADGVLGWAVLVSECKLLINVVIRSKPKALVGLSQNGCSRMLRLTLGAHGQYDCRRRGRT